MKKLVTIVCALVISIGAFAQKNEVKALEKALKKPDYAAAKAALKSAEALEGSMDEKTKDKYMFLKAQTLYAGGNCTEDDLMAAVKTLDNQSAKSKYKEDGDELRTTMFTDYSRKAQAAVDQKDNKTASKLFEQIYRIQPTDTTMLYYAASYAVNGGDYDTSLKYYNELYDLGYTGVTTYYYAVNKETGQEELFENDEMREFALLSKDYTTPRDEKQKSRRAEIVKNIALIYVSQGKNDEALKAMDVARSENPDDLGLLLSEANVHLKMGNNEKFTELMQEATKKDPNNAELQYNLGVMATESGDKDAARKYYEKAVQLDPNYGDAYTNLAVIILSGEDKIVDEMNGLGMSAADNKRYDELKQERTDLYKEAIPFLEKSLALKPNNINAAETLMNIYSALGETDKMKEMKAKAEEIRAMSGN